MTTEHTPNPIDVHVGTQVRITRTIRGLSQEKLGEAIGLTFQQIQKYERGANRISASKLWRLAEILEVPVEHFFEGLERATPVVGLGFRPRRALELVRAFEAIPMASVQDKVFSLVKSLSRQTEPDDGAHAVAAE